MSKEVPRDSSTQGPPMSRNLAGLFLGMAAGGLGKAAKEGVGDIRLGSEFRVELTGHKPWVVGDLDQFDQIPLGVNTAYP